MDGSYEIVDEPKSETITEVVLADDVVKSDQSDLIVRSNNSSNNTIELLSENDNRQYGERNPAFLYINSLNSKQSQKTMGNILCQFVRIWEQLENKSGRTLFPIPDAERDTYISIKNLTDSELLLQTPWRKLTNGVFQAVLSVYEHEYEVSVSRLNSMLVAIRRLAQKAKLAKVLSSDEVDLILDNKVTRKANISGGRIQALTLKETQMVIDSIMAPQPVKNSAIRDACIFAFLFGTGMRVNELASMDMEDIDFEEMKVRIIGKGDKDRTVDIPTTVMALLNGLRSISDITSGPVFRRVSRSDNVARRKNTGAEKQYKSVRLTTQSINDIIKKRYEAHPELAGLEKKTSAHDFRRGFITHAAKEGKNALIIAEIVGHDDPKSTIRYLKETEEAKKEVAESVKFEVKIN